MPSGRWLAATLALVLVVGGCGGESEWAGFCERAGDGASLRESLSGPNRTTVIEALVEVAPADLDDVLDRLVVDIDDGEGSFAGLEQRRGVAGATEDLVGGVARHCEQGEPR